MSLNLDKSTWKRVRLGHVATASKEKVDPTDGSVDRYVAGEHMASDDLKIHRWGNIGDVDLGPAFHRRFRPGQVLYGSRRTYLRKVAVADFDGVCANTTFVVETRNRKVLLQKFLPFIMTAEPFHSFAIAESKGSVNPYVSWTDIERYEFDLPPLEEQKRLADLLWGAELHREALQASTYTVGTAVETALSIAWFNEANLRPIGSFAEGITGSTPSKANVAYWNSEDVPFYTPSEISNVTIQGARQKVSNAGASVGRILPRFAVAVACIGGDMGKSAVVIEPGITNQQITSIVGLDEQDAYLIQALLSHTMGRAAMEARETTTIVRKLNKSDLLKVQIPWPDDRSSLRRLISEWHSGSRAISMEVLSLQMLKQSFLSDVFEGLQ